MPRVEVRDDESLEKALRRFKRMLEREGAEFAGEAAGFAGIGDDGFDDEGGALAAGRSAIQRVRPRPLPA